MFFIIYIDNIIFKLIYIFLLMKENELDDALERLEDITSKIENVKEISLMELNTYNEIKEKISKIENNKGSDSNDDNFNIKIKFEKIKVAIEKVKNITKGMKDYEFVSDYFVNENKTNFTSNIIFDNTNLNSLQEKSHIINNSKIDEDYIKKILSVNFPLDPPSPSSNSTSSTIKDVLPLLSPYYLKEKLFLTNDEIKNIKMNTTFENMLIEPSSKEEFESKIKNQKEENDNIFKKYSKKNNSSSENSSNKEMDKELEADLTQEIFRYTKSMKENAKHFGAQLKKDNTTLNNIEDIQNIDHDKTKTQMKSLKEFNYSLSIGFFKLIFMFILVFVTFAFMLLIMRIFPKFA